ncbi:phage baseplate assembly protein V [Chromobacterium violaceum]|uniref:phage baseplate assembly protein V n=1 Tax=Chromobacterium violaceum TaxID=536 RepID=UPI0009D9D47F|nr:phage baseplate assembly protein V [Chromobacterium violaceum]MBP4050654.1 phage baseplate assembly protein V [Chromobacterium violaceum]MBX9267775.1 phage baseplate assembly protein V [Chromobacterium violaceum]OQS24507.1 hypothetical protein B0T41_16550 [Chromobacterium violaceum]OQS48374.1 hypothetical protein B0T48_10395 [Chromobacterium violaceum]OQS49709.1 hypothetical protein B0T49_12835 [Chromobacterium violaceum]
MNDFADLSHRQESLIRFGTIAEVDHAARRVRVQSGGLTSYWIPWGARRAGQARDGDPPTDGEQVVLLCPSGDPAGGVAAACRWNTSSRGGAEMSIINLSALPPPDVVETVDFEAVLADICATLLRTGIAAPPPWLARERSVEQFEPRRLESSSAR